MSEITKDDITPEFIETLESDLELLKSREQELTILVDDLRTVEDKMQTLSQKINLKEQSMVPCPGGVLSLEEKPLWNNFISELKRYATSNEELTKLKSDFAELTQKQKEIDIKIIAIVPASIRHYKPQITAQQFIINVYDDSVSLIR